MLFPSDVIPPCIRLRTAVVPVKRRYVHYRGKYQALQRQPALLRILPLLVVSICSKRFHRHCSGQLAPLNLRYRGASAVSMNTFSVRRTHLLERWPFEIEPLPAAPLNVSLPSTGCSAPSGGMRPSLKACHTCATKGEFFVRGASIMVQKK